MKISVDKRRLEEVLEKLNFYRDEKYVPMVRHCAVYDAAILLQSIMNEVYIDLTKAAMKKIEKKGRIKCQSIE